MEVLSVSRRGVWAWGLGSPEGVSLSLLSRKDINYDHDTQLPMMFLKLKSSTKHSIG